MGIQLYPYKKFIKRAEADVGLMFTAYNLRRIFNILGKETLTKYMESLAINYHRIFRQIRVHIVCFKVSNFQNRLSTIFINSPLNMRIFNQILI